ncbi:unnamed protein product, partial [Ilex paraguariensis]
YTPSTKMEQATVEVEAEEAEILQVPDRASSAEDTAPTPVPLVVPVPQLEVVPTSTNTTPSPVNIAPTPPQGEAFSAHADDVLTLCNANSFSTSINVLFGNIRSGIRDDVIGPS